MKISPFSLGTIHFIGIGGIGMSALAEICHSLGLSVQGSDIRHNVNTQRLEKKGIKVFTTQKASNLSKANIVVTSSAIKKDNIEYKESLTLGIPTIHRSDLLAQILRLKWSIAVAGSHGKTTITSLIAHMLEIAQLQPTVINGGIINTYKSNAHLGSGDWIIAEADESDGSFTKLFPTLGIVSNLDEEHMDHYGSFTDLKNAFLNFLDNIPFFGCAFLGYDDPDVRNLLPHIKNKKVITYGKHPKADIYAYNITPKYDGMYFDIQIKNSTDESFQKITNIYLNMLGDHNIQNALAAVGIGIQLGVTESNIRKALSSFEGVKRRLTLLLSCNEKARVYDDYAHHPKEVEATLKALFPLKKENPNKRIIAIFQPHRYSRLSFLFKEFSEAFGLADKTYILPVFSAGENPIENIDHTSLATAISSSFPQSSIFALGGEEDIFPHITKDLCEEDIVVFMGAGSVTSFAANFVKAYK